MASCGHFLHSGHMFLDVKHSQAPVWVLSRSAGLRASSLAWSRFCLHRPHELRLVLPAHKEWRGAPGFLGFALPVATTPGLGHGGSANNN